VGAPPTPSASQKAWHCSASKRSLNLPDAPLRYETASFRGSPSFRILLANLQQRLVFGSPCGASHESGSARGCLCLPDQPGVQTSEREGRRRESMRHRHVGLPSGAHLALTKGSARLGTRPFPACTLVVLLFEPLHRLPRTPGLQRLRAVW
jgi:hypothetical protein